MSPTGRVRAPRGHGEVLSVPSADDVPGLVERNRAAVPRDLVVLDRPLAEVRKLGRREIVEAAVAYLGVDAGTAGPVNSVVLSGHQPELFHPGVWVKNFALAGIARRVGATAVNLVVDNDTVKTTSARVPAPEKVGSAWPRLQAEAFDTWPGETPYEEYRVRDEGLFASFADRAVPELEAWGFTPLLRSFWDDVRSAAAGTPFLGERFARARRATERRWGCANLEVPVSRLTATSAYAYFAGHLLANLPTFHRVYNEEVRAYRKAHGIRSRSHPVPELAADAGWLEAPLWGWRAGESRRGRPFARHRGDLLELRVGGGRPVTLPAGRPAERWVEAWRALEEEGLKLRSRALTNTLFARLFVADLFVHGIGGGKYDELTDAIARRFYGFEPPCFLVLSATLLLPLPRFATESGRRTALARLRRDLVYNPQRHLDARDLDAAEREMVSRRGELVAWHPDTRSGRRERYRAIRAVSEALRPAVGRRLGEVEDELVCVDRRLRANALFNRRDYAFCLFPEPPLRDFCTRFLRPGW